MTFRSDLLTVAMGPIGPHREEIEIPLPEAWPEEVPASPVVPEREPAEEPVAPEPEEVPVPA